MAAFKKLKSLSAIIMGAPGGGKGTICNKLKKDFTFNHVNV
jgi:adenylate kinase family enzyme